MKATSHTMTTQTGEVTAKVLAVIPLSDFDGEAIRASPDPRYIVALLIEGTGHQHLSSEGTISFPVSNVAVFAIHSVAKMFMESDVVGKTYRVTITSTVSNGVTGYTISARPVAGDG